MQLPSASNKPDQLICPTKPSCNRTIILSVASFFGAFFAFCPLQAADTAAEPEILSVEKIWDEAPHNAFTDLVRFENRWLCTFREGEGHVQGNGKIRVLESQDGKKWTSAALLEEEGIDLRDPKISVTPDGRAMLLIGGSIYQGKKFITRRSRVAFSNDGHDWTKPQIVMPDQHWLWRVTWHDGVAYGLSGAAHDDPKKQRDAVLWSSRDGLHYTPITEFNIPGQTQEMTIRFQHDGTMIALLRRERAKTLACIGTSRFPYKKWNWNETKHRVGGPEFIVLPDGSMWAAGRDYHDKATTVLAKMTTTEYQPVLTLPSGGDTSYPGMVWHDNLLWMSYYASHEGKTSIYLAKIKLPENK